MDWTGGRVDCLELLGLFFNFYIRAKIEKQIGILGKVPTVPKVKC
jgi:hypothetical protein